EIISVRHRAIGLRVDGAGIFAQSRPIPGMKNSCRECWKMRVTDIKGRTKFNRVTKDPEAGVQQTNGCQFSGIKVLTRHLPERDSVAEIGFVKGHEMGMNIPAVRVGFMHSAKHAASKSVMIIQSVNGQRQPHSINRVRV